MNVFDDAKGVRRAAFSGEGARQTAWNAKAALVKKNRVHFRGWKLEASAPYRPNHKRCLQRVRTLLMPERIKRVSHVESRNESAIRSYPPVHFAHDLLDLAITVMHHLQQVLVIL